MANLTDRYLGDLSRYSVLDRVADKHGLSVDRAKRALHLSFPLIVETLHDWSLDAPAALVSGLKKTPADANRANNIVDLPVDDRGATDRTRWLLGKGLVAARTALKVEADITESQAAGLLRDATGLCQAALATAVEEGEDVIAIIQAEHQEVSAAGWGPWVAGVRNGDVAVAGHGIAVPLEPLGTLGTGKTLPAKNENGKTETQKTVSGATVPGDESPSVAGAGSTAEGSRSRVPLIVGGVATVAVAAIAIGFAVGGSSDSETEASGDTSTTDQSESAAQGDADDDTAGVEDDPSETSSDSQTSSGSDALPTPVADQKIQSFTIPMSDIKGVNPQSMGTADLTFDTETGEICYSFEAVEIDAPFAGHIHVGADGVRGGIVVDFGELTNPATGCLDNLPIDTNDILAHKGSHYAELHDPSGDFTIRGQIADEPPVDTTDLAFVDPDGGGARAIVEPGRIALEGEVVDRATADALAAKFKALDLDGIDVFDGLTVEEGAPTPSGRVVMKDAILFEVGSDRIAGTDQSLVDVLIAVANAEPDSVVTIVGHTDNTGSATANLELSLRRASALRDALVAGGVDAESLRVEGAGDTAPIADNDTVEGRAQNRRLELELRPQS